MTGKNIILSLLSVIYLLRMDKEHKNRERTNLLDLEILAPNCSGDSDNWEPLRKYEGPKTVLEDSDTDEECAVPVYSVPGPLRQDDPAE